MSARGKLCKCIPIFTRLAACDYTLRSAAQVVVRFDTLHLPYDVHVIPAHASVLLGLL